MSPADFKAARKRLGLSISQMAQALGVSNRHVRRLEEPEGGATHRVVTPTVAHLVAFLLAEHGKPRPKRRVIPS